jgi:hypothetical protein
MKTKVGSILGLLSLMVLCAAGAAWARTYTLRSTSLAPGATGTIDAKAEKSGGNTNVSVKVDHLARPAQLTPAASVYVVWVKPDGGEAVNQGVLTVGDNEKGELKMTTTHPKFEVMITAENEAHPKSPSDRVVLSTEVVE